MMHPTLEKVRNASSPTFHVLVKSNLSHLLDIEMDFDFDEPERALHRSYSGTIFGAPLTQEGICTINQLMTHILLKRNIVEEGIFRRSGGAIRQQQLQKNLCSGTTVVMLPEYTIHDVCCVLKQFCRELPQPLLTDNLRDLFFQTCHIMSEEKRLNAIRLLLLLLPLPNRIFFKDLMEMFLAVVANCDLNKMNGANLATVFTPVLLFPRDLSPEKFKELLDDQKVSKCLEFIIDHGNEVFEPPQMLLRECRKYLDNKLKIESAKSNQFSSFTSLIPSTQFCANVNATPKDYTQQMLAELKLQAESMPLSAKNKKVLKNIKRTDINTPLTKLKRDREQQALIKESLKKSGKYQSSGLKSFGSAIKKLMTPNSEKVLRGSGSSSSKKKRSPIKRKSLSGSALINQFEVKHQTPETLQIENVAYEVIQKPNTPIPVTEAMTSKPIKQSNTPVLTTPKCRRSVSLKASLKIASPLPADAQTDFNANFEVIEAPPVLLKKGKSRLPPPPLPPKPSPGTIMRKCSAFSLQEQRIRNEVKRRNTTISTKSLPCPKASPRVGSIRIETRPLKQSPLVEVKSNVKMLRAAFESMSKADSRIPRHTRARQNRRNSSDSEDADENYVCLSSIPKRNFSARSNVKPFPNSGRSKHLSHPQLSRPKQSSIGRRASKSPRSIRPLPDVPEARISVRKQRRRHVDLESFQPHTPL